MNANILNLFTIVGLMLGLAIHYALPTRWDIQTVLIALVLSTMSAYSLQVTELVRQKGETKKLDGIKAILVALAFSFLFQLVFSFLT